MVFSLYLIDLEDPWHDPMRGRREAWATFRISGIEKGTTSNRDIMLCVPSAMRLIPRKENSENGSSTNRRHQHLERNEERSEVQWIDKRTALLAIRDPLSLGGSNGDVGDDDKHQKQKAEQAIQLIRHNLYQKYSSAEICTLDEFNSQDTIDIIRHRDDANGGTGSRRRRLLRAREGHDVLGESWLGGITTWLEGFVSSYQTSSKRRRTE